MGWKSAILRPFAKSIARKIKRDASNAVEDQKRIMKALVQKAKATSFGVDHNFAGIGSYRNLTNQIPIVDYEGLRPYVDRIVAGEANVLWPGKPMYFAKTSGTTSGVKYIPLTKSSLPNHFGTARNALFNHFALTGNGKFLDGKMIFLSGSPEMGDTNGILTGRLSGIVNHQVPKWLRTNQMPTYKTNCIEDWETKVDAIVRETAKEDMRLISGIPPWVQMYYERLLEYTGKQTVLEVFPNFDVFVYGGVNFEPYRKTLEELVGKSIHTVETYPASEGFVAFQDQPGNSDLLLNSNSGIFFEFIPVSEMGSDNPIRLSVEQVEVGVNYAVILHNNAGLWGYSLGDTIEFVSANPYRLKVTGRIKHFISAFGEHVIGKEVDLAMQRAAEEIGIRVVEFTVAPQITPETGLPYHEWFVESNATTNQLSTLAEKVDVHLQEQNAYYADLIEGKILQPAIITPVAIGGFRNYMQSIGKLGGQNKVPRLSNDRKLADALQKFLA